MSIVSSQSNGEKAQRLHSQSPSSQKLEADHSRNTEGHKNVKKIYGKSVKYKALTFEFTNHLLKSFMWRLFGAV